MKTLRISLLATLIIAIWVVGYANRPRAHLGAPSLAPIAGPVEVGTVVDSSYIVRWSDYDLPISTGTATVDLFYTATNPPPNYRGQPPVGLVGEPITLGIIEKDTRNVYEWDTSTVAPGSYWIWSRVNEPPGEENSGLQFIEFSPGILTVAHPGDPIHPAVFITRPGTPVAIAQEDYEVEFVVFDPDKSSEVVVEAAPNNTDDFYEIYREVVTSTRVSFTWDTSMQMNGDWKLRATVTDQRGLSFVSHSRFFVTVSRLFFPDAGPIIDSGAITTDTGVQELQMLDSGVQETRMRPPNETCACSHTVNAKVNSRSVAPLLFLISFAVIRRRRSKLT